MRSSNPAMTGKIFEKTGTAATGSSAMGGPQVYGVVRGIRTDCHIDLALY